MSEYDDDAVDMDEVEDDDEIDADELEVTYPTVGARYTVELLTIKKTTQESDRYPDGQTVINAQFVIKEDDEFEGVRLFSNWFLGDKEDPNNLGREDFNQCFFACTGQRASRENPAQLKQMRGATLTVQIDSGEYKDKKTGEVKGSGVKPKLKSWKQYDPEA